MKKPLLLSRAFALLLLFFCWSCTKQAANEFNSANHIIEKSSIDSNAISMSIANTVATQVQTDPIVNQMKKKAINGLDGNVTKAILDSAAYPNSTNPSCYVFNYVGGGFAIIAADKRVEPLLAFNNEGHFNTDSTKMPFGLKNWMSVNHKNMRLLKSNPKLNAPKHISKLWLKLAGKNLAFLKLRVNGNAPADPPCQDGAVYYGAGPYVQTTWNQWEPFNGLCPAQSSAVPLPGNKPTGCIATAMAQIMYYWHYPSTYSWSSMPLAPSCCTANYPVAQLMLDAGTSVNMVYSDWSSKPTTAYSIPNAFKYSFGYSTAYEAAFDRNIVTANLDYGQPVMLSGDDHVEAHEWVCDGYTRGDYTICPSEPQPSQPGGGATIISYLSLHMNWGWGGVGDGYYGYDTWSVFDGSRTHNFPYNMTMVYGIHP